MVACADRGNRETCVASADDGGRTHCKAEKAEAQNVEVERMTDAKPCPFCGSNDLFMFAYPYRRKPGLRGCYVRCNRCGASSGNHETVEDAVKAWNERHNKNKGE